MSTMIPPSFNPNNTPKMPTTTGSSSSSHVRATPNSSNANTMNPTTSGTVNGAGDKSNKSKSNKRTPANTVPLAHVSESSMDFLFTEVLHYVESSCNKMANETQPTKATQSNSNSNNNNNKYSGDDSTAPSVDLVAQTEESKILAAEMSAAKLERMGYSVGFRLCERLAQHKSLGSSVEKASQSNSNNNNSQQTAPDPSQAVAASQLEAVKFLCKEFWIEVFRKQIDKLQTNHRGVFVLKDLELKWLSRLPANEETARVAAIQLLAFPCGLVRGALSNLGIIAVVSCDFLADGQHMAACSFNIKIK